MAGLQSGAYDFSDQLGPACQEQQQLCFSGERNLEIMLQELADGFPQGCAARLVEHQYLEGAPLTEALRQEVDLGSLSCSVDTLYRNEKRQGCPALSGLAWEEAKVLHPQGRHERCSLDGEVLVRYCESASCSAGPPDVASGAGRR